MQDIDLDQEASTTVGFRSLRDFLRELEATGQLLRVREPVDPKLEVTELCYRSLRAGGPALLFEHPTGSRMPLLGNLFGTFKRAALGMGRTSRESLRELGCMLASLKEPKLPQSFGHAVERLPTLRQLLWTMPRVMSTAPCQENVLEQNDVDLTQLPIQTCWPEDAGPLITFGVVVTRGPYCERLNLGIYRQQVIAKNRVIMRWLPHRGGALDFQKWQETYPGRAFPVAVAIGTDPATTLAAVTPVPDSMSEYQYAGLLRGARSEVVSCLTHSLQVPAHAEIVLEGYIHAGDEAVEGPFGDHTGYYNEPAKFPVLTVERMTYRNNPIYNGSYTGRSPFDEPSVLAMALNEVYVPVVQRQFPEIIDFYLPPEACSYRFALVSIKKRYPGHARRIIFGIWSSLPQFTYTKFVIVVDDDIDVRAWSDVIWALSTRMDPERDTVLVKDTPIDYLDFASPVAGLGGKIGFDATNKWPGESDRPWGRPIARSAGAKRRVDELWDRLGIEHHR